MSSATPAGAIQMQAAFDLSNAYAALAQFRAEAAKPVGVAGTANFVGPGGVPLAGGAAAGAFSSAGPATFANPGGRPTFVGPAGLAFQAGANGAFNNATGGNNLGQAGQQLTAAAQALTQAAQALAGAGGGGAGGAGGGGSSGANRILGLRAGGLMRYVGAAFIAREALNVGETIRDYSAGNILAQGRPRETMANELNLYDRVSKVPIFGQLASLLIDPAGTQRLGIELQAQTGEQAVDLQYRALENQMGNMSSAEQAASRRLSGFKRERQDVENTYQQKKREAAVARMNPADQKRFDEYAAARRAQVEADFGPDLLGDDWQGEELIPGRRAAAAAAEADILQQRRKFDKGFDARMKTVDDERKNSLKKIDTDEWRMARRLQSEAALIGNPDPAINYPGPATWLKNRGAGRREDENEAIRLEVRSLEEQYGDDSPVPKAYRKLQEERLRREDFEFDQQARKSLRSMTVSTRATNLASGHDVLTVGEQRGTRQALAQLQGIIDTTESRRLSLLDEFGTGAADKGLLHANAMQGRAQLVAFRQQFDDSIRGVSVNPFTQSLSGVGTLNEQKIRGQIDRAFNQVGSESTRFPGDTMGNGGGEGSSKEVASNTKDMLSAIRDIRTKIDDFTAKIEVA